MLRNQAEEEERSKKQTFNTEGCLSGSNCHESMLDLHKLPRRTECGEREGVLTVSHGSLLRASMSTYVHYNSVLTSTCSMKN